jgi:aminopeptidase N
MIYLICRQYQTAEPDDLYRNLQLAARDDEVIPATVTIKAIMDSWANQKGFPMLYVSRSATGTVTITQVSTIKDSSPYLENLVCKEQKSLIFHWLI